MAWRKAVASGPAAGQVAVLLAYEAECEAAGAGERLAVVRSWLAMLGADPDPEVAGLFCEFARADRGVA